MNEKRYEVHKGRYAYEVRLGGLDGKVVANIQFGEKQEALELANLLNAQNDTIERLTAALKPFAEAGANYNDGDDDQEILDESIVNTYGLKDTLTLYDLRNARRVRAETEGKGEKE